MPFSVRRKLGRYIRNRCWTGSWRLASMAARTSWSTSQSRTSPHIDPSVATPFVFEASAEIWEGSRASYS